MLSWTLMVILVLLVSTGCGSLSQAFLNASWRDRWQQPETVIAALSIQPGDHVADLGAGGGYFTFRLADAVGPTGRVYAVDVNEDHPRYITRRAKAQGYANVTVIHATDTDPLLPEGRVDLIVTCNTYHYLQHRVEYFASAARSLRPRGRVAIIDLAGKSWFLRLLGHWTPKATSQREREAAGYLLANDFDFLTRQHLQVFRRRS